MLTTEDKYEWLCRQLKIVHVDLWEKDALVSMPEMLYFQFYDCPTTVDAAIVAAMESSV